MWYIGDRLNWLGICGNGTLGIHFIGHFIKFVCRIHVQMDIKRIILRINIIKKLAGVISH